MFCQFIYNHRQRWLVSAYQASKTKFLFPAMDFMRKVFGQNSMTPINEGKQSQTSNNSSHQSSTEITQQLDLEIQNLIKINATLVVLLQSEDNSKGESFRSVVHDFNEVIARLEFRLENEASGLNESKQKSSGFELNSNQEIKRLQTELCAANDEICKQSRRNDSFDEFFQEKLKFKDGKISLLSRKLADTQVKMAQTMQNVNLEVNKLMTGSIIRKDYKTCQLQNVLERTSDTNRNSNRNATKAEQPASRTIFVANLDHDANEKALMSIFGKFGAIESINFRQPESGVLITFQSLDMASRAKVTLSGQMLGKRQCFIRYWVVNPSNRVWIEGLVAWISFSRLKTECERFGSIKRIEYIEGDSQAFVEYQTVASATSAVEQLYGYTLGGPDHKLCVGFAFNNNAALDDFSSRNTRSRFQNQSPTSLTTASEVSVSTPSPTIFVNNLETDSTEEILFNVFRKYGTIKDLKIIKKSKTVFAFIYFQTLDMAKRAQHAMSGQLIGKLHCRIDFAKGSKCIRVDGLDVGISKRQLNSKFSQFGTIQKINYKEGDQQAFIEYRNMSCELRGLTLCGRQLTVSYVQLNSSKQHQNVVNISRTLFADQLDPEITYDELISTFVKFGIITNAQIIRVSRTRVNAYVQFLTTDMAARAKQALLVSYNGRVSFAKVTPVEFSKPCDQKRRQISDWKPKSPSEAGSIIELEFSDN